MPTSLLPKSGAPSRFRRTPLSARIWTLAGIILVCISLAACQVTQRTSMGTGTGHLAPAIPIASARQIIPVASSGCGKAVSIPAGTSALRTVVVGTSSRAYLLHLPTGYQPRHPYPLVLNFHGHGSTAMQQQLLTGFSQMADARGFIVAYPQGVVGPDHRTGWASGGPNKPQVNDILFVHDLIASLQATLCVDNLRIYATGFSNGGGMTSVLACTMAQQIAAFAAVSGSYFPLAAGCHPAHPVPVLEFHGTGDTIVPYAGRPWQNEMGALEWVNQWAARDGCKQPPTITAVAGTSREYAWNNCRNGVRVIHYQLAGGIHTWPGGFERLGRHFHFLPVSDRAINATSIIWQFFQQYSLPR